MRRRFRNGFKEEGKLELCLGREAEISQVEKRDGGQSLKGERRLGKMAFSGSDDMLKETRIVVQVEGNGGRGNGEISRSQIMRNPLCHTEKFKLYPVVRV